MSSLEVSVNVKQEWHRWWGRNLLCFLWTFRGLTEPLKMGLEYYHSCSVCDGWSKWTFYLGLFATKFLWSQFHVGKLKESHLYADCSVWMNCRCLQAKGFTNTPLTAPHYKETVQKTFGIFGSVLCLCYALDTFPDFSATISAQLLELPACLLVSVIDPWPVV